MNIYNLDMTHRGTFSFLNNNIRQTIIQDDVSLRIQAVGPEIARVYFVRDDPPIECPVPIGITVLDHTNQVNILPIIERMFMLVSSSRYTIFYNGEAMIYLEPQRQYSVRASGDREVDTIENV